MNSHTLRLEKTSDDTDRPSTGYDFAVYLDGQPLHGVRRATIDIEAGSLVLAHLTLDEVLVIHVDRDAAPEQLLHLQHELAYALGIDTGRVLIAGGIRLEAVTVEDTDAQ